MIRTELIAQRIPFVEIQIRAVCWRYATDCPLVAVAGVDTEAPLSPGPTGLVDYTGNCWRNSLRIVCFRQRNPRR